MKHNHLVLDATLERVKSKLSVSIKTLSSYQFLSNVPDDIASSLDDVVSDLKVCLHSIEIEQALLHEKGE